MPANVPANFSPQTRPGPGAKLVKVGVIGLGEPAKSFARATLISDKLKIIAGFSHSAEERRAFQLETRLPVVSDVKTLLSYPMLDGVILNVPSDQQLALATDVARAKKHLFITGAVGSTLDEGLEIAALEQKHGITISAAHFARLLGGIREIRGAIDRGELGILALIEVNFSCVTSQNEGSNSRPEQRYAPGDSLSDMAILFDVLQYLGGEIAEVSAMSAKVCHESPGLRDQITTLVHFADGKLGYAGSSRTSPGVFALRVLGSKGLMHYEADTHALKTPEKLQEASMLYIHRGDDSCANRQNLPIPRTDAFAVQLEIFAEACRTGSSGEFSAANASSALAVCDAALRSLDRRGQSVRVADLLRTAQSRIHPAAPSELAQKR
jgi:predicted dehydrogenase